MDKKNEVKNVEVINMVADLGVEKDGIVIADFSALVSNLGVEKVGAEVPLDLKITGQVLGCVIAAASAAGFELDPNAIGTRGWLKDHSNAIGVRAKLRASNTVRNLFRGVVDLAIDNFETFEVYGFNWLVMTRSPSASPLVTIQSVPSHKPTSTAF